MSVYLVACEPDPGKEKQDEAAIQECYQSSAQIIVPGLWVILSGPNSGIVQDVFLRHLGYRPRRCLVSSIQGDNALRLDLERFPEDSDLEFRLNCVLPNRDHEA